MRLITNRIDDLYLNLIVLDSERMITELSCARDPVRRKKFFRGKSSLAECFGQADFVVAWIADKDDFDFYCP